MEAMQVTCILEQSTYKPGDQAPEGYLAWHEWAETQHKAGLRQKECGMQSRKGPVTLITAVCNECADSTGEPQTTENK